MRRVRWPWLLMGTALIASAVVIYTAEWVEITTDQGPTLEALRNPYLAADQYLGRLGVQVDRQSRLSDVAGGLGTADALVMTTSRATLSGSAVDDLLRWVGAGGQLVALAINPFDSTTSDSHDPLLDRLGVRLVRTENENAAEPDEHIADLVGTAVDSAALCRLGAPVSTVTVDGTPIEAQFTTNLALATDASLVGSAHNDGGDQLVQLERGSGLITVLTTTAMWRNSRIGCHDHAHLLGLLLGDSRTVFWLAGVEMPPLYMLIWQHFPYGVCGALLALLLWAWSQAFRFGPVRGAVRSPRRSLLEHVRAAAGFYWRRRRAAALLEFLRHDLRTRAGAASEGPLLAAAAQRADLTVEAAERALAPRRPANRDEFVACVQVLQRLRKVI